MVETQAKVVYSEWQLPNFGSFLPNLLFAPAVWLVFAPIDESFGTFLGIALTLLSIGLRIWVAKRIVVDSQNLRIGKADIPLTALGETKVIESADQFQERGPKLDARAFLALKGGLPGLVKIEIVDHEDPTPYILVATRNPQELAAAISKR